ncbi:hypothetical protein GTU79_26130 [Sodalis ligni]|uniref:anti-sigma factor family protein n=1 Tax=Sodalis ligni TaxID=2697027 RepID=UPI00193F9822|nr:hypothetical protein [Sodalis ligni]QWA10624.1 hypothetical protein GTU79_26130 [Sodalis ligni]
MTKRPLVPPLTDELLVAYLDNELDADQRRQIEQRLGDDPQLAERLALLDQASLPFSAAYAVMLNQAPAARLRARLESLTEANSPNGLDRPDGLDIPHDRDGLDGSGNPNGLDRHDGSGNSNGLVDSHDGLGIANGVDRPDGRTPITAPAAGRGISRRNLMAAAVAGLAVGILGGRLSFGLFTPAGHQDNWRDLVAEYMSLYTDETFADTVTSPDLQRQQLKTVGARLGLTLDPGRLSLPGAELKFARLLSYDRQPIAQIAYLDESHGPLALCITRAGDGRQDEPESEVLRGMNVVYWAKGGHRYMLIGHNPPAELNALAQKLMAA